MRVAGGMRMLPMPHCVMLTPSRCQSFWYQHQILQSVINTYAIFVDNSETWFDAAAVSFPEEILDIDARRAAALVFVSVGKYDGTTPVLIDLRPSLESILVHQTYISFI